MTRLQRIIGRLVVPIAHERLKIYYAFKGAPTCRDCGHPTGTVFHVEHEIAIRKPRWIGFPRAVFSAMFTHMPTTVRCPMCQWMHERNLNA